MQIKGATTGTSIIRVFLATGDAAFGVTPFAEQTNSGMASNATEVRIRPTSSRR